MVSGYIGPVSRGGSLPAAARRRTPSSRLPPAPRGGRRGQHRRAWRRRVLASGRPVIAGLSPVLTANRLATRRVHRHRPGLVHARLRTGMRASGPAGRATGSRNSGSLLRPPGIGRTISGVMITSNSELLRGGLLGSETACPASECLPMPGNLGERFGDLVVQQPGDHEASARFPARPRSARCALVRPGTVTP